MIRLPHVPLLLLATTLAAQSQFEGLHPRLRPFRQPNRNIQPPLELFRALRIMQAQAKNPGPHKVEFDADGREVCASPEWQKAREEVKTLAVNQGGYLLAVLEESSNHADRLTAAYGAFYLDNPQDTFGLIARLPGEPTRALREWAFPRAIAFVRAQWVKNGPPRKVDPEAPQPTTAEAAPLYDLALLPFAALLETPDPVDQAQGCWFLRECLQVRPQFRKDCLGIVAPALRKLIVAEDKLVRQAARDLLSILDRNDRAPKGDATGPEQYVAWLDQVTADLLPPIRPYSEGLIEIWPGKQRDDIVRVGLEALEGDAIGGTAEGKKKDGFYYRGFRIARLPVPLEQLRLPLECVITSVNGTPTPTGKEVLQTLRKLVEGGVTSVLVEYVHKGESRILEYRLKS